VDARGDWAAYRTELLDYDTTMKAAAYLAINPMGKLPAIRHGDVVVTEAAAICAYLADVFPEARLPRDTLRFQDLSKGRLPRSAALKPNLAQTADQRVGECQVAFPVVLSPALARCNALIQKKAVQHQPRDTVDKNTLSFRWVTTQMLNQAVAGGCKETALSTPVIDGAFA
jgi:hypothetical protein